MILQCARQQMCRKLRSPHCAGASTLRREGACEQALQLEDCPGSAGSVPALPSDQVIDLTAMRPSSAPSHLETSSQVWHCSYPLCTQHRTHPSKSFQNIPVYTASCWTHVMHARDTSIG